MSFDWTGYLTLAQELVGQGKAPAPQEARSRAAVSRAYYAAFCQARNHLRDRQGQAVPSGGDAHRYVWSQFKGSADRERKAIGENGERLREDRRKADYDDVVVNLPALSLKALARSGQIIARLSRL